MGQWQLLDAVSSMCSLWVLLWAMETTHTTQIALSQVTVTSYSHTCARATYTSCGYYSRVTFILFGASDHVTTIQGQQLLEGGIYLKKYGNTKLQYWSWFLANLSHTLVACYICQRNSDASKDKPSCEEYCLKVLQYCTLCLWRNQFVLICLAILSVILNCP